MAAQREWFEKDYYKVLGVVPTATDKEITAPIGSWPSSTTPTPTRARRSASRRSARRTTSSVTPRSARSTTRSARTARSGGFGTARPAAAPSAWRTWATWATSSGACSATGGRTARSAGPQRGADMEAAAAPVLPGRRAWGHHLGQRAPRRALLELPRQRRRARDVDRTPARAAAGPAASTTTRACSRSARSAPTASGGARCSTRRARSATAPVPSSKVALGQGPHPGRRRGRPAHPGEGPGRAGPGHGARRATSMSSSTWASTRSFGRTGAT